MEQQQIAIIMKHIANNYREQLSKLDSNVYYENLSIFLYDEDYLRIANNLKEHIKNSPYLPKVSDLVKPIKEKEVRPYIPTALETKQRALQLESGINPATEEERKQALQDIKKKIIEGKKEHEKRINRLFE